MATQTVCDQCRAVIKGLPWSLSCGSRGGSLDFCQIMCVSAWVADEPKRQRRRDEVTRTLVANQGSVIPWSEADHA